MKLLLFCAARIWVLALAAPFLLGQGANCQDLKPEHFKNVKTLKAAVEVVKERLKRNGKPEYAALLSEIRVQEAIHTAVKGYEGLLEKLEKRNAGTTEYFQKEIEPICLKIADKGEWPQSCSFFAFYALTDMRQVAYDGLGLRLQIDTPQAKFEGFALPIVDLYFGRPGGFGE